MTYCISDIHGHFDAFTKMLQMIEYDSKIDELYLLGDYVDWGSQSAEMLEYVMELDKEENVHVLLGNHDLMMLECLEIYMEEGKHAAKLACQNWIYNNGGNATFKQLLSWNEKRLGELIRWLRNLPYRYDITLEEEHITLVHSFPAKVVEVTHPNYGYYQEQAVWNRDFAEYGYYDCSEQLMEKYCPDTDVLVFGHTISEEMRDDHLSIWKRGNCYDIDCGAKLLGMRGYDKVRLACLRLEDKKEYYLEK